MKVIQADAHIGAVQGKSLQWHMGSDGEVIKINVIDTTGFQMFRSRRLINRGHGEEDRGQYDNPNPQKIFGAEGACVLFRREALEDVRVCAQHYKFEGSSFCELSDEDFFWYGDDIDLVWRMCLYGWEQVFVPSAIMWHDRQTTKSLRKSWRDFIRLRRAIPIRKRRLDWANYRLAILKNDFAVNILKDLPWILKREILLFGYLLFFEPQVLLEIPRMIKLLPRMLKKRSEIIQRVKVGSAEVRHWFLS